MPDTDTSRFAKWAFPAMLGAVVLFWSAHVVEGQFRSAVTSARARAQVPFAINGLQLPLDRVLLPSIFPSGRTGRYLLLVASDRCQYSLDEFAVWTKLLRDAPLKSGDSVVIISLRGNKLAKRLAEVAAKRHLSVVIGQPIDAITFGVGTGLSATPATAILDSRFRIRLVTERVSPAVVDEIVRIFAEEPVDEP